MILSIIETVGETPFRLVKYVCTYSFNCRLLHAETIYSQFDAALVTKRLAEKTIQKVKESGENLCLAGIYTQFSIHSFFLSEYHQVIIDLFWD